MILESVEHGPLIWLTIEENGVTRTKKYEELSATEKIQADCDLKGTNIILQGLPSDVYSLINHHRVNIKFLNSLLPRWSKFVMEGVVKCFNCQGDGHMARQCPKPKKKRDAIWFRDKVLLVKAQGYGKVLNEEEFKFLADPRVTEAKAVLMANLSSYGPVVLSEVSHYEKTHNDMLNQSVQDMSYSAQTHFVNYPKNEITSDSNIIPYSQYLLETQNAAFQDTNSSTQQDAMILSVFEQLSNQVTNCNKVNKDNLIANEFLSAELERYKEWMKLLEERQNVDLSTREKLIIDDII
nr:ribonuclease H-like domain-containing protein [Tanacetum cinerariifolium]